MTIRFLDSLLLTPASLVVPCQLCTKIVGRNVFSVPEFALKSSNKNYHILTAWIKYLTQPTLLYNHFYPQLAAAAAAAVAAAAPYPAVSAGLAVYGVGLQPRAYWDCKFESRRGHGYFVCCECCVLSGRGLCDGPITRPEQSYRVWCD
jgi:hypothetical protein